MKRNLIIIVCLFLGLLALMVTGNIIIVGEKIAAVSHLWWMEWVFYGLIGGVLAYFVLLPLWRIHHTPAFPALAVDEEATEEQLKDYGKRLAGHCGFIEDAQLRKEHRQTLENNLLHASGSRAQLLQVVRQEVALRYDGDKSHGILGINGQIREWAKTVFMITAVSQNSRFDTLSVMWLNYKMIESLVLASGFRPNNRDADAVNVDPDDIGFDAQMTDTEGLSIYSILRRIKIPGVVVGSALDGTVNALMTLRIGYITRTYLQQGEQALTGIRNKRAVKWEAMKESLATVPAIVAAGSSVVGKKTSNLIIRLINSKAQKEAAATLEH